MPRSPGRTGGRWRDVSAAVIAAYDHCWVCGKLVDKSLSGRHPRGPSVDHVIELSMGGAPLERGNLRLAHLGCNVGRSNTLRAQRRRAATKGTTTKGTTVRRPSVGARYAGGLRTTGAPDQPMRASREW